MSRVVMRGGPKAGFVMDDLDSQEVYFPIVESSSFWVAENVPMWKQDSQGDLYFPCQDGKYRTVENKQAVYQRTVEQEDDKVVYQFSGYKVTGGRELVES